MKVYGWLAPAVQGRVTELVTCQQQNISCIIDDGLFIKDTRILAGVSAKERKQSWLLFAVHYLWNLIMLLMCKCHSSCKSLIDFNLGTSINMIERIAQQPDLPRSVRLFILKMWQVTEYTCSTKAAQRAGKHIIPVPTLKSEKIFRFLH